MAAVKKLVDPVLLMAASVTLPVMDWETAVRTSLSSDASVSFFCLSFYHFLLVK